VYRAPVPTLAHLMGRHSSLAVTRPPGRRRPPGSPRWALILLAAALLPALAPAVGLGTGDGAVGGWEDDTEVWVERPDGSKESVEVHPQIKYYAEAHSVTINEARRRLGIRDAVQAFRGELRDELGDSYAGVWIEHEPEHRVPAAALPADAARVADQLEATSFSEVAEVGASLADLDDLAARVREASPVPIDTGVTVSQNAVKVHVAGDAHRRRLDGALAAAGLANRPDVAVETVSSLARPLADIRGGRQAIVGENACTTGFSVRCDSDGVLGVLTAAHCGADGAAADDAWIEKVVAPFQEGRQDGRWDVQWHTVPGHNITNEIEYVTGGSTHREKITGVKELGDIGEGDEVCKSGIASSYTCGTVTDNKVCPGYVKSCERTFILVRGGSGGAMAKVGDSGGPVFSGNDAVGIVSGAGGSNLFYMPVDYISVFGLSVLTYEPPPEEQLPKQPPAKEPPAEEPPPEEPPPEEPPPEEPPPEEPPPEEPPPDPPGHEGLDPRSLGRRVDAVEAEADRRLGRRHRYLPVDAIGLEGLHVGGHHSSGGRRPVLHRGGGLRRAFRTRGACGVSRHR